MEKNYKNYFKYYLISISVFAFIWLYLKHGVGNDSTISEWIINYQGGFGRRGLLGELFSRLSIKFNFPIRDVILYFLYFIFVVYYSLIYLFFRNLKKLWNAPFCTIFLHFHNNNRFKINKPTPLFRVILLE